MWTYRILIIFRDTRVVVFSLFSINFFWKKALEFLYTVVVVPSHLDKNENYFAVNEKCKLFVVCRSNLTGGKIEIKERDISHTKTVQITKSKDSAICIYSTTFINKYNNPTILLFSVHLDYNKHSFCDVLVPYVFII